MTWPRIINTLFCHVGCTISKRVSDAQTNQGSIFPMATGGLPTVSFIDNHQVLLFILVLSGVWLIPGLWELVSDCVTLKNEGWIIFGLNQVESTLGRGHTRILPQSALCTPGARLPTLYFSDPKPTHNSISTPALLTYSTASALCFLCWPPASHYSLPWTEASARTKI